MVRLYEIIAESLSIDYYFTGGNEEYSDKKLKGCIGNFSGQFLKGFFILPKFKITPSLLSVFSRDYAVYVKTVDDRFAVFITFIMAKIMRKPFVLWTGLWHHPETFFHKCTWGITKVIYQYSDAIITYGDHVKDFLIQCGISSEKIFSAGHAIDNQKFNKCVSEDEKRSLKEEIGVSCGKIVLFVGRITECKGIRYLVEALEQMKNEHLNFVVIGSGGDQQNITDRLQFQGIKSFFLGHILHDELYKYYAIADVFVLPSITTKYFKEPWGLVVNEAMNQSCPIIATNAVGAAAGGLVKSGENGFVVKEKNSQDLKDALIKILSNDELRIKMGRMSKEKIIPWTPEKASLGFKRAIHYAMEKRNV